jgi:hypothetical protein
MLIDTQTLKALAPWKASSDVRYYLTGVFIEKTGTKCRMTASDGHAVATSEWEDLEDESDYSVIIPGDLLSFKTISQWLDLDKLSDDVYRLRDGLGWSIEFRPVDGTFPDCESVWPRELSSEHWPVDPALIARIEKTCKAQKIKTSNVMTWPAFHGLVFRAGTIRWFIMGLRHESQGMPTWREV